MPKIPQAVLSGSESDSSRTGFKKGPSAPAKQRLRSKKYHDNINKRGKVVLGKEKKEESPVGPWMLGFILFVVIGSSLFQIIRTAQTGEA